MVSQGWHTKTRWTQWIGHLLPNCSKEDRPLDRNCSQCQHCMPLPPSYLLMMHIFKNWSLQQILTIIIAVWFCIHKSRALKTMQTNPDYFQNLMGTSLSKDTSMIKFPWTAGHWTCCFYMLLSHIRANLPRPLLTVPNVSVHPSRAITLMCSTVVHSIKHKLK